MTGEPRAVPASSSPPRVRVRWKIFAFLFGFGFMAYLQQRGITVAAYQMMPLLGLSQMQIGWLETALLIGYTAMQFPGGVLGQRLGARRTAGALAVLAGVALRSLDVLDSAVTLPQFRLLAVLALGYHPGDPAGAVVDDRAGHGDAFEQFGAGLLRAPG